MTCLTLTRRWSKEPAHLVLIVAALLPGLSGCRPAYAGHLGATYDTTGTLRVLTYDADRNAKPDTWGYMDGARILRIEIDHDEDGAIERWEYYDDSQALEKVGLSLGNNGVPDRWLYAAPGQEATRLEWARAGQSGTGTSQIAGVPQQVAAGSRSVFGIAMRPDKTTLANVRLQLRHIDTNSIVGRTVSDTTGAFTFAVPVPGLYVVEAIDDDGALLASSKTLVVDTSSVATTVVLPAGSKVAAFFSSAGPMLAAAAGAGVAAWTIGGRTVASPEQ